MLLLLLRSTRSLYLLLKPFTYGRQDLRWLSFRGRGFHRRVGVLEPPLPMSHVAVYMSLLSHTYIHFNV